jgi:hypothetical protein
VNAWSHHYRLYYGSETDKHGLYYSVIAYTALITLSIPATIYLLYYGNELAEILFKKGDTKCEDEY